MGFLPSAVDVTELLKEERGAVAEFTRAWG